ncbi:MAG: HNH endonuclease, partial [Acinetobacter sp.]
AHGGTDDPGNLQSLCAPCHREKTANEGKSDDCVPNKT